MSKTTIATSFLVSMAFATFTLSAKAEVGWTGSDPVDWGQTIEWMAELTWADKNCKGHTSPAAQDLRAFFRKHLSSDFEEALLNVEVEHRNHERIFQEQTTHESGCFDIIHWFGPYGRKLPTFWFPSVDAGKIPKPPQSDLSPMGKNDMNQYQWGDLIRLSKKMLEAKEQCGVHLTSFGTSLLESMTLLLGRNRLIDISPGKFGCQVAVDVLRSRPKDRPDLISVELSELRETENSNKAESSSAPVGEGEQLPRDDEAVGGQEEVNRSASNSDAHQAFEHGVVRKVTAEAIAPLRITTVAGSLYAFKLLGPQNSEVMFGLIEGGKSFEAKVPTGIFSMRYCSGEKWIGEKELFGSSTVCAVTSTPLIFDVVGNKVRGSEVQLFKQAGGNLETQSIDRGKF